MHPEGDEWDGNKELNNEEIWCSRKCNKSSTKENYKLVERLVIKVLRQQLGYYVCHNSAFGWNRECRCWLTIQ